MTLKTDYHRAGINRLFAGYGPKPFLDKENEGGAGNPADNNDAGEKEKAEKEKPEKEKAEKEKAEKEAAEKEKAEKEAAQRKAEIEAAVKEALEKAEKEKGSKLTDKEAELLKEVMARKQAQKEAEEKLKAYEGIDPDEYRRLKKAADDAEKARIKAEREAAEKAGDVDRVKKAMADEHKREKDQLEAQMQELRDALDQANRVISDLTVGAAFANSTYIVEQTVLTPDLARTAFGDFFDTVDGKIVAYDKPKGAKERTPLVKANGENYSFEEAIQRLVEARPDKDKLLRSNLATGAQSRTSTLRPTNEGKRVETGASRGLNRIAGAIKSGALQVKPA